MLRKPAVLLGFLLLSLPTRPYSAERSTFRGMRVILAPTTFTPAALKELQPIADQVAHMVDELIPGEPQDYPPNGIICFEAPSRWTSQDVSVSGFAPPITVNGLRTFDEPVETSSNQVRIAVTGVQAPDKWRFAFQLSHELAHVKMGTRTDNYLDETLAVALSYEVLLRLGYEGYLLQNEGIFVHQLPPKPQQALASNNWIDAKAYWVAEAKTQNQNIEDRAFQTLGAALILWQHGKLNWNGLLNASQYNTCSSAVLAHSFRICDPDLPRMKAQKTFLKRLGLL